MDKLRAWLDNHTPCTVTRKPWRLLWALPAIWLINFNLFWTEFAFHCDKYQQSLEQNRQYAIPAFATIFTDAVDRNWFLAVVLVAVALGAWLYVSHHQKSQSVYLMRRLPDRWEYHRRCLTLPLCLLAGDALAWATLYATCVTVYGLYP